MKEIIFNDFVFNMNDLDIARYFIAMLYLAMKGKVEISYDNSKVINNNGFCTLEKEGDDREEDCYYKTDNRNSDLIKISVINN